MMTSPGDTPEGSDGPELSDAPAGSDAPAAPQEHGTLRRNRVWIALVAAVVIALIAAVTLPGKGKAFSAAGSSAKVIAPASTSSPPAELPPGGSAHSVAPAHPGANGQSGKEHARGHIRTVVNNGKVSACSLINSKQVDQIMQDKLPRPRPETVGTFDQCVTTQRHPKSSSSIALHVAWADPPEAQPTLVFKQMTVNLPHSDAIGGLGDKAYCSTTESPRSAQLFILHSHAILEVFADTCGHATALARVALSKL